MTELSKRIVLKGAKVIDVALDIESEKDLLIEDGKVAAIDKPGALNELKNVEVINLDGKVLTPGLIDIHVHLREPGQEWKETILSGSEAAVAGGFTTVCCMPNTLPTNDNAEVTKYILRKAEEANLCRVYPIGAISLNRKSESLAPMLEMREAGCIAFSDDGAPVSDAGLMRRALEYNLMLGSVLTVHEEESALCHGYVMNESATSLRMGLKGMPGAAEDIMIARDIELARLTGGRVHFQHVSTARAVTLIKRAKEDGIPVTAETAPHYFTLTEKEVENYNTQAKVSMPLRSELDREGVLQGVIDKVIDCIASDHAPHEADTKNREFDHASFGFIGLQTMLPLTLAKVRSGNMSLKRAIETLTVAPAKCFNLNTPSLKVGSVADITVMDLNAKYNVAIETIKSKSKNTPFMGKEMQGAAVLTIVGGRIVYRAE
ncbi:MAG: dihydroorotase [Proteobacteria bacterium]|nr:dihydroorotase [Pseudomonadota bacterium]